MKIETKYNVGQHIWIVCEQNKTATVYDDYIGSIVIDATGYTYGTKESYEELQEEQIILYEDNEKLLQRIKNILGGIDNEKS